MSRLLAITLALVLPASLAQATPYTYHTYDSMVAALSGFEASRPDLIDVATAEQLFGLPQIDDNGTPLDVYVVRVTNEATGLNKPELLLTAVQHGNEVVGLETSLALIDLLISSYGTNRWLTELVDRREIYILPLANPHGFRHDTRYTPGGEGSAEDMNRDHIYDHDNCSIGCDATALSTVGARALYELARRHLFRVMVDYHGGVEMIIHPWGTPLHTSNTESPDQEALSRLGALMSDYGGPYNGAYPVGTANDLLGPVAGPLDDTSYAAGWDRANADPGWPTVEPRALAYTVEISNAKRPPESTLGGDAALLTPGGAEDGYVPKTVRVALAAIDVVEPYVVWTNRSEIPTTVAAGSTVQLTWEVRGCFAIDETRVRWGTGPDLESSYDGQTAPEAVSTASPCFEPAEVFQSALTLSAPGLVYVAPVAQVDGLLSSQTNPTPAVAPQSWLVRSRVEQGLIGADTVADGENNEVWGHLVWQAPALAIQVVEGSPTPTPSPTPTATPTATPDVTQTPTATPTTQGQAVPTGLGGPLGWALAVLLSLQLAAAARRRAQAG